MEFNTYQDEAMTTNSRPRLFTEDQVRAVIGDAFNSIGFDLVSDVGLNTILDRHSSPLSYVIYPVLGLLEEAGEIAGKVKKTIRDDNGILTEERTAGIILENGDVLWYQSAIADALKHRFSDVAKLNLKKLASRAARGVLRGSGDDR